MASPIQVTTQYRDRGAARGLDRVADRGRRMGGALAKAGKVAAVGLAVVAVAAAGMAAKVATAAAQDEQSAARMAQTFEKAADAKRGEISATEAWITQQGKAYGVVDDELRPALSKLVTATRDVGQAQRLASLAMDVSAGTGKSLEQVSTALMKAQNGQVSSLSRLGIKTKNAAGDTISMTAATKRMSTLFGGAAASNADTLQGRIDRLKLRVSEAGESLGYKLLPRLLDVSDYMLDTAVPHAEALWKAFENNGIDGLVRKIENLTGTQGDLLPIVRRVQEALGDVGDIFTNSVIPAVSTITNALPGFMTPLGLAADTLGFMADHADLTKNAIILLTGALAVNRASMILSKVASSDLVTSLTAQADAAERAATKQRLLRGAIRGAAGAGGFMLMTRAAEESNDALGLLESAGGGAMLGFAVGGPIGAAIGGGAGALMNLATRTDEAKESFKESKRPITDYASSLDEVSGKATQATRNLVALALESSGAASQARSLGISSRDVVSAVLGQAGAMERVNRQMAHAAGLGIAWTDSLGGTNYATVRNQAQLREYTRTIEENGGKIDEVSRANVDLAAQTGVLDFIGRETDQWRASSRAKQREILLSQDLRSLQGKIPKRILSKIESTGIKPTIQGVARLVAKYDLADKRQVRAILSAVGIEPTVKGVQKVRDALTRLNETPADLPTARRGLDDFVRGAAKAAGAGARDIRDGLETPLRDAKPDLSKYTAAIPEATDRAKTLARTGSTAVGVNLKTGAYDGLNGMGDLLAGRMAAAVNQGLAAARQAAQTRSPSRKTYYIGAMMAKGGENGVRDGSRSFAAALAYMVTLGTNGVEKALGRVTTLVEKTFATRLTATLKRLKGRLKGEALDKALKAAERASGAASRAALKSLRDEESALTRNAQAQDRLARRLDRVRDRLERAQQAFKDYAAAVKAGIVESGNVTTLGQNEDGSVSSTGLVDQLKDKLIRAQRFGALIAQLTKAKLNPTALQQIIDRGVDGGLATAEALAAGGSATIAQVNTLTQQLAAQGAALGQSTAETFHGAGVTAAQSLVDGLEARAARLDKVAQRLANRLAKAIRKALNKATRPGAGGGGGGSGDDKDDKDDKDDRDRRRPRTPAPREPRPRTTARPVEVAPAPQVIEIHLTADALDAVSAGKRYITSIDTALEKGARTRHLVVTRSNA